MTEDLTEFRRCMKGTSQKHPRCAALLGEVGSAVRCTIYEGRPSPCREFGIEWDADHLCYTAEDLELLGQIAAHFPGRMDFSWLEALDLFQRHPELAEVNAQVQHKNYRQVDERRSQPPSKAS